MADKVKSTRFEMKAMSGASSRGDVKKPIDAGPHVSGHGQIKQDVPNNKSASPIRRHSSEGAPADTTTTIRSNSNPTRRNQSALKSTPIKSPRQRARRTTAGTFKGRLQTGPSPKNQAVNGSPPRNRMARCIGTHVCSGCKRPIKDRYLLGACDKYWHENCLKCDRCHAKLGELGSTLYERANMNLCRQDYLEMFGRKAICAVCDKLIYASEMVMRARDNVYHLECFACQLCGLRFCIGDRFHLCENKIVCQYDYDEHICPLQSTIFAPPPSNYTNSQQFPTGPPLTSSLGSIPAYQQSVSMSEQLGGYDVPPNCLASDSNETGENQSELISCIYSQTIMLESNQITKTTNPLDGQETAGSEIRAMPMSDQDQQAIGERVELTVLGGCEPRGKSNESETMLIGAPIGQTADLLNCDRDESKRGGDGRQTEQ